ncbi:MAG TPA: CRISPR-associated endoribonuclease Cas6, partial [Firmicutes bacterium]|nr:CRISPR-associated endoribonuclease Cas6 [Bacillota bacterium]
QSLVNTLLTKNVVRIGSAEVQVEKIFVKKYQVPGENISIYTLSPVVLYSTLLRPDGGKYTCYYQPGDPDYNRLISENLRNKYRAYHGTEPPAGEVKVKALGRQRFHVLYYKDTVIKGYTGRLQLCGPAELLQLAVDAGLGGKNSQGFGCVKLLS